MSPSVRASICCISWLCLLPGTIDAATHTPSATFPSFRGRSSRRQQPFRGTRRRRRCGLRVADPAFQARAPERAGGGSDLADSELVCVSSRAERRHYRTGRTRRERERTTFAPPPPSLMPLGNHPRHRHICSLTRHRSHAQPNPEPLFCTSFAQTARLL